MAHSLEKGHLAALYLDPNRFKDLNDTYGHQAGDIALRVASKRLRSAMRGSDFVARPGGDEFVCVVIDPDPQAAAPTMARHIPELLKSTFSFNGTQHVIAPSVGVAVASPGTQWETILFQSDTVMYQAKQDKTGRPVVICKTMGAGQQQATA